MSRIRRAKRGVDRAMYVMEEYTGVVPGYRRAHPRGLGFRGRFTSSAEAAALTTAEHLRGNPVETVVRLSNAAGSPYAPDRRSARRGNVLGLAVRFELLSGGHSTWAAASIPAFPASTPEEFVALAAALQRSRRTGRMNPLRLLGYVARHPRSVLGLKGIAGLPSTESFATTRFNGLHAYYLVDAEGRRRAFRYRWLPDAGTAGITREDDRLLPPQYLISEIKQRVERGPMSWSLVFQLADPGDPADDISKQWPEDRRQIPAGRLVLDRLHEDQGLVEGYVFDPTNVPSGIELSDDPILRFRPKVYAESERRRTRETKPAIGPE